MTDKFDQRIQVVRLAQKLAKEIAASEVPRNEWNAVLEFVRVMIIKGAPRPEGRGPQPSAGGEDSR